MDWTLLGRRAWHGVTAMTIVGVGALQLYKGWPTSWEWMLLGAVMWLGFVTGVNTFNTNPNQAIPAPPLPPPPAAGGA